MPRVWSRWKTASVLGQWILERIDHPNFDLWTQALHMATWKRLPGAIERIEAALAANPNADCRFALSLAELKPGAAATERLIRLIGSASDWDQMLLLRALLPVATECRELNERLRLARICSDCIKHRACEGGGIDIESLHWIELLGTLPAPAGPELLEDIARSTKVTMLRSRVLEELAKRHPARAKELSAELGATCPAPPRPPSDEPRWTPERQRRARHALDICVHKGLLASDEAKEAWDMFENEGPQGSFTDDPTAAMLCFANRFLIFDAETGTIPNPHDELLGYFAEASAGKFRPTAVLQEFQPDEPDSVTGRYTVQFIHGRKLYRFQPRNLEDWYDVPAVLAAANRALDDTKTLDRFINLEPDGQFPRVIFAPPELAAQLAGELGYALCSDADKARRQGQAYERRVQSKLAP